MAARRVSRASKAHHIYQPGDTVEARFEIVGVIASGGMAEVYEAVDSASGERVALKTPNLKYADQPKIVGRMEREFKALIAPETAWHPNLVRVLHAGRDGDQFYYVMELLEGRTLGDLLAERGPLPIGVALSIAKQIASAVHALHRSGIVHRDLKPHNVMVLDPERTEAKRTEAAAAAPEGAARELVVKVIDLGVAKFEDATTTSEGVAFGTVTYMAPEQTRGDPVDARTDVYAIGLILYEMVAGVHPMRLDDQPRTHDEWLARQQGFVPLPIKSVVPSVSPLVCNILDRMLGKEPGQRFPDALELAHQLEAAMAALRMLGQLGPTWCSLAPLEDQPGESGPQPIVRHRPPGTSTPGPALGFHRTEEAGRAEAPVVPPPPPIPMSPEPPRVAAQPEARTKRGTVPMLGPKGTKPNLDAPRELLPGVVAPGAPPAPPPPAPPPPPTLPSADDTTRDVSKARWQDVPDAPLKELYDGALWRARSAARSEPSEPSRARSHGHSTTNLLLRAVALGLLIALIGVTSAALIVKRAPGSASGPAPTVSLPPPAGPAPAVAATSVSDDAERVARPQSPQPSSPQPPSTQPSVRPAPASPARPVATAPSAKPSSPAPSPSSGLPFPVVDDQAKPSDGPIDIWRKR